MDRKVGTIGSAPVHILAIYRELSKTSGLLWHQAFSLEIQGQAKVWTTRDVTIHAEMESRVIGVTSYNALMTIERTPPYK